MENNFVLTDFINVLYVEDKKGKTITFKDRYSSCFIITIKGSIEFSFDNGYIISDINHPVFLPKGLSYVNKCTEDAQSFVFNFLALDFSRKPAELSPVPYVFIEECYNNIKKVSQSKSPQNMIFIFSELYLLAYKLFDVHEDISAVDKILSTASEFIMENYSDCKLTVGQIAKKCCISEIYLRKLFEKKYNTTPYKMITNIRMEKAYMLLKEKRPVKEIALSTGYSDVYQFSRAYKKHFGYSPKKYPCVK